MVKLPGIRERAIKARALCRKDRLLMNRLGRTRDAIGAFEREGPRGNGRPARKGTEVYQLTTAQEGSLALKGMKVVHGDAPRCRRMDLK